MNNTESVKLATLFFCLLPLTAIISPILSITALINLLKNEFTGYNKIIWLFIIWIPFIGPILYFTISKKQKKHIESSPDIDTPEKRKYKRLFK